MSKVSINHRKNAIRLNWAAVLFLLLVSTLTFGDETKVKIYFDIREQPLGAALIEFSDQADIQLMISTDLVENLTSPGVRGRYRPTDALAVLLTGTGLAYHAVGARSIVITSSPDASSLPRESSSGRRLNYQQLGSKFPVLATSSSKSIEYVRKNVSGTSIRCPKKTIDGVS